MVSDPKSQVQSKLLHGGAAVQTQGATAAAAGNCMLLCSRPQQGKPRHMPQSGANGWQSPVSGAIPKRH